MAEDIKKQFAQNLVSDLTSKDDGIQKQAAADFNDWLVTYQRQDGVFRSYMPPQPVTEADFAEELDDRDPVIYRSIKPRSAGALSVNFDTGTISTGMYANKYKVYLHRAWTPKYRIDRIYLTAYKNDLLGCFKDLSLQDLLGLEDLEGMSMINACVGAKGVVNPDNGIKQYIDGGEVIDTEAVTHAVKGLTLSTDLLSPAKALVNRAFWWDMVNAFKADQAGDNLAEKAIMGNLSAQEESMMGIRWVTVLDPRLVPAKTVYVSADSQYCGNFFTYGEAKLFTEVKDDIWFEMYAHEMYGMSMPFRGCVVRVDFQGTREDWQ